MNEATSHIELCNPTSTAVIVIDKQRGYLFPEGEAKDIFGRDDEAVNQKIAAIDEFIEVARTAHVPIIWTQMVENVDESPANLIIRMKGDVLSHVINSGDATFEIVGSKPQPQDKVIVKYRYDAFIGTDLDDYLKAHNIKTLILVGYFTSRCLLATGFVGSGIGYNILVPEDLTDVSPNRKTELPVAFAVIASVIGFLVPSNDIVNYWQNK